MNLIAPCGMNCGTCLAYLREKNRCMGCTTLDKAKPATRLACKIKICEVRESLPSKFCYDCPSFPCKRLKQLDKRYRLKYNVSFIGNLLTIKEVGMDNFLTIESARRKCPSCGAVICVHRPQCLSCGYDRKNETRVEKSL